MRFARFALAAALGAAWGIASAADLLSVYRDALVSDSAYQAARAQYNATRERLPQARAGYLPLITGTANAFRNDVDYERFPDQRYSTHNYGVSLSQPVIRVQNWIAISQADKVLLQAEAAFAFQGEELALRVAQAYFDVLLAQDNVALSGAQKSAISEQLAQAKRNFEVGTSTIVDTLEAQARFDQANAKEIADQVDLEVKKRVITVLLGKLPDSFVPLREPLALSEPRPNNIEEWVKAANDSSFTVAVAKAGYEIAKQEVDRQRAGHLPTVDLTAAWNNGYDPTNGVPSGPGSNTKVGTIGLQLSVPIFAGGLTQSRVREAVALRDKAEQDLETTQRTVAQTTRQLYLTVVAGIAGIRALEQALTSTQSQLDSTILGRDVGVRTSVDVLNAQQQVFQTRRDLQQVRYNFLLNTLRLKAAAGQLAEADVAEVNRALGRN
jgi:outer membrane protein